MSEFKGSQNYVASEELMRAVNIAMVLEKPLLIKGEPGTGKTMLAEAISQALGKKLIIWNIKSTTKAQDGLYVYDVVQRLYDSQFGGEGVDNIEKYVKLGKLGEAFTADEQVILLIDEIDKADLGSSFAACFGVLPNTSFSQNVGLVAMTKVVNRGALATGAIFLILCGLIPKLGALVSIMPQAVLGGAAVMMFSSIVVSGIQLITKEKMTPRTLTIVSVALGVGYGMGANASILAHTPQLFQLICGESGIVPAAFVAIVLNVLLPKDEENA